MKRKRMPDPSRVLVVAPNWLGDAVMALPAIADMRRHFVDAAVIVAARPSVAPLFSIAPGIDEVMVMQWRGAPLRRRALRDDVERLARAAADVAIPLPNSFASAWIVERAGVRERWGYASDLRRPLLTRAVRRPRGTMHQGAYYQHLMRELGMASGPLEPAVNVSPEMLDRARALLQSRGWDGTRRLVAIAPGAAYGTAKRWLPPYFARVLTMAARAYGAQGLIVGSAGDGETAQWVMRSLDDDVRATVIDVTGATSLDTLAGVLRLASVCVSNDSGAMHLAGAVGAPLAALFGPTREYETAPLPRHGARARVLCNPVWCRPCMLRECPIDHRCMTGLSPEHVFAAVEQLMDRAAP
jgi:heptosyltransferase-2